jgi:hypothetical protein
MMDEVPGHDRSVRRAQLNRQAAKVRMKIWRKFTITVAALAMGGGLAACGLKNSSPSFEPGQVWTFRLDKTEPASTLTVLKVESVPKHGDVVHISVSAIRVPEGVTSIQHLPMSQDAMERSVLSLVRTERSPPDLVGYETWARASGGVFKTSVEDALRIIRENLAQNPGQRPKTSLERTPDR